MKTGYYTIKNTFKESDPESKGIVSRYVDKFALSKNLLIFFPQIDPACGKMFWFKSYLPGKSHLIYSCLLSNLAFEWQRGWR